MVETGYVGWEIHYQQAKRVVFGSTKFNLLGQYWYLTHRHSLDEGSLGILMTGTKSIINSRLMTVETINDKKPCNQYYPVTCSQWNQSGNASNRSISENRSL